MYLNGNDPKSLGWRHHCHPTCRKGRKTREQHSSSRPWKPERKGKSKLPYPHCPLTVEEQFNLREASWVSDLGKQFLPQLCRASKRACSGSVTFSQTLCFPSEKYENEKWRKTPILCLSLARVMGFLIGLFDHLQ